MNLYRTIWFLLGFLLGIIFMIATMIWLVIKFNKK